jgi:2'-5' RNA ligase
VTSPEQASLSQRWAEYQQLDRLRNHWYWRPGWRPGRSFYTWHLIFDGVDNLRQLVTTAQARLVLPSLTLVPLDGLHLTMQGLGFTDEVNAADLDAIVSETRTRCRALSPFTLNLGPVDPDAEGIGLLIQPWQPVTRLRATLRDAIGAVWPEVPEAPNGFRPHVTIAYSNADTPAEPVREQLEPLRTQPPATVEITTAQLIRLNRDEHEYRWDVHASVDLGDPDAE